ncbi:MAG: ligase-associated DNA damage response endonuclease PdeM, partial [Pseudomonadota bacterium]
MHATLDLAGERLEAQPSGALWWPARRLLAVADLHLGRSERVAREGGALLPPYETEDTLNRLEDVVLACNPRLLISLGDSFDDLAAARSLGVSVVSRLERLAAGRRLIWIAGNHDPGPVELPGTYVEAAEIGPIAFRHIADPEARGAEISAHYHPKVHLTLRGRRITRRCFLASGRRVILPAFGAYTGGLEVRDAAFEPLMGDETRVYVLGKQVTGLP